MPIFVPKNQFRRQTAGVSLHGDVQGGFFVNRDNAPAFFV